jgi:PAS domain S-box-containing protein
MRFAAQTVGRWTQCWHSKPAFPRLTVTARIAAITLSLAAPLNLAIITIIQNLSDTAAEAQRTSLLYTARSVAAAADAKLDRYMALAEALARSPAIVEDNLDAFEIEARRVLASSPHALVTVANPEGQELVNTARQPGQHLPLRSATGFASGKRAFETHSTVVSDVHLGAVSQSWVISIDVPIFKNEKPFRTLVVAVTAQSFFRLLNERDIPKDWLSCIVDRQGHIIARAREGKNDERSIGQLASESWRNLKDHDGVFESSSLEGESVVAARTRSAAGGWGVGIAVKKASMQAATWGAIRWALIIGGGFSILSLAFAIAIARSITGPIERLRYKASAFLSGAPPSLPVSGPPEVEELWYALQQSAAALRESEERFRGIFENAGTGIAIADLEGRFERCNPAYAAMLGYSQEELRELTCPSLLHPEDREANIAVRQRLLAQEIPSFEIVNRYIGKGSKLIWLQKHVSLLRDAAGKPTNTVVLATDVTERKRQEDHIRLLMREVNHRSKNLLTVVQAIARQTAAGTPNDFAARFEQRVQALAASQDELVKNDWRGAMLDDLVRSQLAHFKDLIGTRIKLHGPRLFVTASAAQALGMTLHELATNAGKYGALANGDGRVAIKWRVEEENSGEKTFTIFWREKCECPVTPPFKRGFGSTVICEMAEHSLGAKVDLAFPGSGLNWRLQCPAAQIVGESHPIPITKNEKPAKSSPATPGLPRALVLEDEAVVAIEIAQVLTNAGFEVVGPARTAGQALQLVNERGCDVAVLDVNLGSETSERVALRLMERGTPFITLSGYSREQHPLLFNGARSLAKPLRPEILIAELKACMAERSENRAPLPIHQLSAVS